MKRVSAASAAFLAGFQSDLGWAKPSDILLEDAIQALEDGISLCKSNFATKFTLFFPNDEPSRALDEMTRQVCLEHTHNLPCK